MDICCGGEAVSMSSATDSSPNMRRNEVTEDFAVSLRLSTAGASEPESLEPRSPKMLRAPVVNCDMGSVPDGEPPSVVTVVESAEGGGAP